MNRWPWYDSHNTKLSCIRQLARVRSRRQCSIYSSRRVEWKTPETCARSENIFLACTGTSPWCQGRPNTLLASSTWVSRRWCLCSVRVFLVEYSIRWETPSWDCSPVVCSFARLHSPCPYALPHRPTVGRYCCSNFLDSRGLLDC